ncbi:hypothetical protein [Escherichia phage vB_EcoM_JNE01]|nr:hypothetical protein [Escherichia phage vB_EcoM_JNE01]
MKYPQQIPSSIKSFKVLYNYIKMNMSYVSNEYSSANE